MTHEMTRQTRVNMANALAAAYGRTVNRQQIQEFGDKFGINPVFLTKNKAGRGLYDISEFVGGVVVNTNDNSDAPVVTQKTDAELVANMRKRFRTLDRMAAGVVAGQVRSMIVSGPAGIGKTYTIEGILERASDDKKIQYHKVTGFIKATGLYKILWENRFDNNVILLDDSDSAFDDEVALNLLKAALDSNKRRMISWRSEKVFVDGVGDEIPNEFEYRGSIVFITNKNFNLMISQGRSLAPHFQALISRSFYIDLNFDENREYVLRIEDILRNTDMAYSIGLDESQVEYLIDYVKVNAQMMYELSLRMVSKLAKILSFADSIEDFEDIAASTCLRRK